MKKNAIVLLVFIALMAACTISALAGVQIDVQSKIKPEKIVDFAQKNWITISLIVSEILAFLPTKASGILHSIRVIWDAIKSKQTPSKS